MVEKKGACIMKQRCTAYVLSPTRTQRSAVGWKLDCTSRASAMRSWRWRSSTTATRPPVPLPAAASTAAPTASSPAPRSTGRRWGSSCRGASRRPVYRRRSRTRKASAWSSGRRRRTTPPAPQAPPGRRRGARRRARAQTTARWAAMSSPCTSNTTSVKREVRSMSSRRATRGRRAAAVAPAVRSSWRTSRVRAARKQRSPTNVLASHLAPCCRRYLTTSMCPARHA
mmetsp:Transcript_15079/g.51092  ORF Transcript_15079/g.51092 Transcript_15079/m.51092 type:complete len:227 (-) Transcript_15079:187-867(-)